MKLKPCPKCGLPEGSIYCPVCHGPHAALRGAAYRELLAAGARMAEGSRLLPCSEERA